MPAKPVLLIVYILCTCMYTLSILGCNRDFIGLLTSQVNSTSKKPSAPVAPSPDEVIAIGEIIKSYLERVPVSVSLHLEDAECVAQLDRKTKYAQLCCNQY